MANHFAEIDGKPHVIDDGKVNLGIAVDVEKKGGGRTLMVPVIRDAGRLTFPQFLDAFNALIGKARENKLTADDLQGANVSLTNPGGIGTIASVPRLMNGQGTIVATGSIGYPPGLVRDRRHDRRRERRTKQYAATKEARTVTAMASGTIRRLMTNRPHVFAVQSTDDRRLAVALIGEESVSGVEIDRTGLTVRAGDYGSFTRALPKIALRSGIRVRRLLPSDESLESVFSYLVEA